MVFINFLLFFWNFILPVGWEQNAAIIFIFYLFLPFPAYFGILYYASGGNKTNNNFYFLSFSAFSNLFWLEMKPQWYFLIFLIFWLFYWNFLLRVGLERSRTITFIFLLSHPFPTYFGLKWILNDIF